MNYTELIFICLLPVIAFFYASVGHGGASGYLALMALFSFPVEVMKPTGLLLNLFVAGVSFINYYHKGYFNTKLFLYFALGSIPLSFLGGMFNIDTKIYKVILGIFLLFAILKMLNIFKNENTSIRSVNAFSAISIGAFIGFFSGLIGIGGGIILSPVILLLRWGDMKEAAAVSALFIWVNSASGMIGQLTNGIKLDPHSWTYVLIAVIGGFGGAYVGSSLMKSQTLRFVLAFVLLLASIKLILV
ncbi:sulfite exporter TauE/SafE family protein [bacterium]|nr:MAG: sulfite exporter TauE/SafE family protein [bacterium]